jgi:DNA-directed RNA polymerase subunit RPC12/RpoP
LNQAEPTVRKEYPCGRCGAKVDFAPGTSVLKCPYCGFETPIPASEAQVEEQDYRSWIEQAANEKETHEAHRVKCDKCGAETTMPPELTAGICPFCGVNMVFSGEVSRLINPEGLLPFKYTKQAAFEAFRRWIRGMWFAPGDLRQYAQSDSRLAGIYIPYWTYDSDTTTAYTGERGNYYYTTETYTASEAGRQVTRTRQVRHTRWTPVSGTVRNTLDDILVLASKSLPRKYAESLDPWDLKNIVPYADEYLSGFRAESYQVSLTEGFEEAKVVMASAIRDSVRGDIGGDEQRIKSEDTQYGKITFKHILLPIWMSAYRFRDRVFRILINARTGEVQGERPYSPWKIAGAVLLGLVIVAVIVLISMSKQG